MVTATFRFYGNLNDFLAPARRGRSFSCPCARAASAKHMIEALGVPHTEVALVLIDGEPASPRLDHMLREDERVAVYPKFEHIDISPLLGVSAGDGSAPRFVADAHLVGLARLLRMAGFDTLYDNHADDARIAEVSVLEQRIVLTRDRDLLKRRVIARGCYVRALKADAQLREVAGRLDLCGHTRPFSLCLRCNVPLHPVDKAAVAARLPPAVAAAQEELNACPNCGAIFWKGSHWKRMSAVLAGACG